MVDATPSLFTRACAWLESIGRAIFVAMQRSTLSEHLPSLPVLPGSPEERAERVLLEIMRAPPEYIEAAILIARATRAVRKRGDDVFAEGFVAFALSRMATDDDGTVPIKRLREQLREMPVARSLVPVLLRLEEQGVVALETPHEDASTSGVIDLDRARVRLLVVP
jgi:hypothetical protein